MPTRKDPQTAIPATTSRPSITDTEEVSLERKDSLSSNSSESTPATPVIKHPHVCPSCQRGFSRAEHLERHLATHLPPSEAKTYFCTLCSKGFTRKDVLNRHIKAVHQTKKVEVRKSRRRSCQRCAGFKIRCSSGATKGRTIVAPCEACFKRGHECVFDSDSDLIIHRRDSQYDVTDLEINDDEEDGDDDELEEANIETPMEMSPEPVEPIAISTTVESREPSLKRRRTLTASSQSSFHSSPTSGTMSPHLLSAAQIFSNQEQNMGSTYPHYNPNLPGFKRPNQPASQLRKNSIQKSFISPTRSRSDVVTSFPSFNDPNMRSNQRQASTWPLPSPEEFHNPDTLHTRPQNPIGLGFFDALKPSGTSKEEILRDFQKSHSTQTRPQDISMILSGNVNSENISQQNRDFLRDNMTDVGENWYFDPSVFELDFVRQDFSLHDIYEENQSEHPLSSTPLYLNPKDLTISTNTNQTTENAGTHWMTQAPNQPAQTSSSVHDKPNLRVEVHLPLVNQSATYLAEDSLPWDWQSSTHREPRIVLPPLRELLEASEQYQATQSQPPHRSDSHDTSPATSQRDGKLMSQLNVTENVRQDMLSILRTPYDRRPYNNVDLGDEKFPSKEILNDFIQLYIKHFHDVLPMLHIPTFSSESCPSILLVAIATIGARYHTSESAIELADNLNALCHKTLTWLGEYNDEYKRSTFYLMAFCFQSVYALSAGNKRLFEITDASRSFLINACRNLGLFSGSGSRSPRHGQMNAHDDPFLPGNVETRDSERLQNCWISWRDEEFQKRLAWCIFECDCSISVLTNRRGNIALNDLSLNMPCEEILWEAPDAQTWAALYPKYRSSPPRGVPFYSILREITNKRLERIHLSSWGRRLCAQAIGRMIWDFKEIETSPLSTFVHLPVLSAGLKPAKDELLTALMSLLSLAPSHGDHKSVDSSMTCMLAHYSHIYATRGVVDLAISLVRNSSSTKPEEHIERISKIQTIFTSDLVNARELAWHSAQILAAGRRFNLHTSCDSLRVFIAGVYLHAFAKYFPVDNLVCSISEELGSSGTPFPDNVIRLDTLSLDDIDAEPAKYWIKHGGKARLEYIRDLHSIEGAREVLRLVETLLQRMKLWGIGEKFLKVVQEILQSD